MGVGGEQRKLDAFAQDGGEAAGASQHLRGITFLPDNRLGSRFLMTVAGAQWAVFRSVPRSAQKGRKAHSADSRAQELAGWLGHRRSQLRRGGRYSPHTNCPHSLQSAHQAPLTLPAPPTSLGSPKAAMGNSHPVSWGLSARHLFSSFTFPRCTYCGHLLGTNVA